MPNSPEIDERRKGLRFEVFPSASNIPGAAWRWSWAMVGAEGPIAVSPHDFEDEPAARRHIQNNKGRLGNARRAKVVTVNADKWEESINE